MAKNKPNVGKIIHKIHSKPKDFVFFIVFNVLVAGFTIASIVIASYFVNNLFTNPANLKISLYVGPLVLVVIGLAASIILLGRFKSSITANVAKELKEEAYLALLQADMSEFDKNNYENEVASFVKNVEQVSEVYIGHNILSFISTMVLIISIFIACLIMEPLFALIVLALIPLYTTADKTCSLFVSKTSNRYEEELKNNSEATYNAIKNLKNIKLLSGIDLENDRYQSLNYTLSSENHKKNVSQIISHFVLPFLFIGITMAAIFGVGGLARENDAMNILIADYLAFLVFVPILYISVYSAFHYHLKTSFVEQEVGEIEKIIGLRSEIRSEPVNNLDDIHVIKFDSIYDDNKALSDVSLEIKQGEKIGILSLEKGTRDAIFNLITKISRPDEGLITINNCELNKINAKYLRTLITSISDESVVFDDTIINNICYGREFDEYKYNDALYRSGLKQVITNLEDKDQTLLDNNQKDELALRVIFASAFYQDGKIYLLDDAGSNIDAQVEAELINEIIKLKNKTIIIETDKAYLLNKCDRIIIFSDGKIVEEGSYKELMSNKQSNYYRMIKGPGSRKQKVS